MEFIFNFFPMKDIFTSLFCRHTHVNRKNRKNRKNIDLNISFVYNQCVIIIFNKPELVQNEIEI